MATKKSRKGAGSKESAVHLNKSQASVGKKIILIFVIVAFVASFIPLIGSIFAGSGQPGTGQQVQPGSVEAINNQYSTGAEALAGVVASNPTSYTALVNLGNQYIDWGGALYSSGTTAGAEASAPIWANARDTFAKAVKIKQGESEVEGNYAIALYYTGDTAGAIKTAEAVVKRDPKFAPVWFNLGIFYTSVGENAKAIAAYETVLSVESTGDRATAAKQAIAELKKQPASTTTTP